MDEDEHMLLNYGEPMRAREDEVGSRNKQAERFKEPKERAASSR